MEFDQEIQNRLLRNFAAYLGTLNTQENKLACSKPYQDLTCQTFRIGFEYGYAAGFAAALKNQEIKELIRQRTMTGVSPN